MSAALASALVLFLAPAPGGSIAAQGEAFERQLASVPQLSVGILSATQGPYTPAQMVLDMTQGARVASSAYDSPDPPPLRLSGSRVASWSAAVRRARNAPQLLDPGLLAAQIPGGAAYVPAGEPGGVDGLDGVLAADRSGRIAEAWGAGESARDIRTAQLRHRLVVADLPDGAAGCAELRTLASQRAPGELLIVVQRAGEGGSGDSTTGGGATSSSPAGQKGGELLWVALAGLGAGRHTIVSQTTNERGMVTAIDIAPTILEHLRLPVPAEMRGEPIRLDGALDGGHLRRLKARLGVISGRRLPALGWLLIVWALVLGAARLIGRLSGGRLPLQAWALRVGALAVLWAPVGTLLTAALYPSRTSEFALLALACFALGALSDRALGWPRAPILPAGAAVLAIVADALAHTQLLMRSLLGPDPQLGARFYGVGNELKAGLAVLVLCAVAATLFPAARGRRAALAMGGAGALLALVEGAARIGAGVGAVVLVSAGTAVAVSMLLPGALTRRRALIATAAPVVGLVALAALDLATAHGGGHFTASVLHARSAADVRDILVRRYSAAWDELRNHLMPLAAALALGAGTLIVTRRERLCAPVGADPAWMAALCGGVTAGAIGALSEDSGPVLLVVAVGALACVLAYLWGKPGLTAKLD